MTLKRIILAGPRHAAMTALRAFERGLLNRAPILAPKSVFVIGPPRSGTSLLFELLATRFRFSYFSNAAHRLYLTPASASLIFRRSITNWHGDFRSSYGKIAGFGAPSEGGWIWDRWLPGAELHDRADLSDETVRQARRTVGSIAETLGAPFLSKNVMHSVQMQALDRIFPGCVFLEIQRDAADCVRSILRLRRERNGPAGMREWISVKPPGWQCVHDADPVTQVATQVFGVRERIRQDALAIGADRLHVVNYERLCQNPEIELQAIARALAANGIDVGDRIDIPESFPAARRVPLDDATESAIRGALGGPFRFSVEKDRSDSMGRKMAA